MWLTLAIISLICSAAGTTAQRYVSKTSSVNSLSLAFLMQLAMGAPLVGFLLITHRIPFGDLKHIFLNIILCGVLYACAHILIFMSLKRIDAAYFSILFTFRSFVAIIASSILLSEGLNKRQLLGFVILLAGILIAYLKPVHILKKTILTGSLIAIAGATFYGLGATNDKFLLNHSNLWGALAAGYVFTPLILGVAVLVQKIQLGSSQKAIDFNKIDKLMFSLTCVLYLSSAITFFLALSLINNASRMAAVNSFSVVMAVIFSILLLREREDVLKKVVGSLVAFVGLVLLA